MGRGTEGTYSLGTEKRRLDMVMLVVQIVRNVWLDIYRSRCQITVIQVVNFLYHDCTHIPWKRNFIYKSVYTKNGAWQFQELLHLPNVTFCWWKAANKSVALCDLSIIFVLLPLEHPVLVTHKTVDGKTKGFKKEKNMFCTQFIDSGTEVM